MEEEKDVCSKCALVELSPDYPYYHCEECRKTKEAKNMNNYEYLNIWASISELLYYATHEE